LPILSTLYTFFIILPEWVEERKGEIEIFYLPRYSPGLNPDEYLNQDVKTNAVGRRKIRDYKEREGTLIALKNL
jgi:transposase